MGRIVIGISGWRYAPWRGVFYPADLPQHRELAYAGGLFPSIELNGSFYSLQTPQSYARWRDDTPEDFVFAVKGSRYITHIRRLREIRPALANFFASGLFKLRAKLGPLLWQFPPNFRYDRARFEEFFELLPRDTAQALRLVRGRDQRMKGRACLAIEAKRPLRHAIEIRHESFIDESFIALLRQEGIALVVADTAGKWPFLAEVTTDFMYLRLHGDKELYRSGYTEAALDQWADRIRLWAGAGDVYCYFDNDAKVKAPFDAAALMRRLGLPAPALPRQPPRKRQARAGARLARVSSPRYMPMATTSGAR